MEPEKGTGTDSVMGMSSPTGTDSVMGMCSLTGKDFLMGMSSPMAHLILSWRKALLMPLSLGLMIELA